VLHLLLFDCSKNPNLNCKMNTGHMYMIKGATRSLNLLLSDEPKNTEIGAVLINIQSD